jgi:hypothetical protein
MAWVEPHIKVNWYENHSSHNARKNPVVGLSKKQHVPMNLGQPMNDLTICGVRDLNQARDGWAKTEPRSSSNSFMKSG